MAGHPAGFRGQKRRRDLRRLIMGRRPEVHPTTRTTDTMTEEAITLTAAVAVAVAVVVAVVVAVAADMAEAMALRSVNLK